jgi:secretion/DNA translocation related TadE-like protein
VTRRRTHRPRDDGIATVWAAAAAAVIMAALLLGLHLGAAVAARHRAEAAADLAALAAAGHAVHGTEAACRRAEVIADRMGAAVARCLLSEWDALVEVHVAVPLALPGTADAVGRARAGPAEPDPAGTLATTRNAAPIQGWCRSSAGRG